MSQNSYNLNHRYEQRHEHAHGDHDGQRRTIGDQRPQPDVDDHSRAGERRWQRLTEWASRR